MTYLLRRLHEVSGQFSILQGALVSVVLHPQGDSRQRLGTLILFDKRQNALEDLILILDSLSNLLTVEKNRKACDLSLRTFAETWRVADNAKRTIISLS